MFRAITTFELKYHLKAPLFYILFAVYFLLTFGAVASDAVIIGGAVGAVNRNAPYVIMMFLHVMTLFAVLTTTAFVANSVYRDFELRTDSLFFSSPLRKWQYLGGRFAGSFLVAFLVYSGVALAIMIGSLMPWVDKERLGPFELWPYVFSMTAIVLPNLLLCGAIFFAVTALTRSLMATYVSVVAFFVGWGISSALLEDIEHEWLAAMLDPFGFNAASIATRYWTVFEKNTRVLELEGVFLWNRVLWIGIALLILAFALWKFDFSTGTRKASKKVRRNAVLDPGPVQAVSLALPKVRQTFGGLSAWRQYAAATRRESVTVFKSLPFLIIVLLGIANIWGHAVSIDSMFGTSLYPVTQSMVRGIYEAFAVMALLIAAFYAGDIVWRERSLKVHEVHDAMPVPTWAIWASKATALVLVVFAALLMATATSIVIQLANGYTKLEPALYVKGVFLDTGSWLVLLAGLSFLMQVFLNQKFVGFLGVMAWFILNRVLPAVGWEHRLYRFASRPPNDYSDMNGYGHFVQPLFWFTLYWMLLVAALLAVGHLLWVRSTEGGPRQRLRIARQRFSKPVAAALVVFVAGFVATGCYIYYNTNVLNEYRTTKDDERRQAELEKRYKKFERIAQPRITDVQADVALYPERRAADIRGTYTLVNRSGKAVSELHVTFNPDADVLEIAVPGARLKSDDAEHGYRVYALAQPLQPGATTSMRFRALFENKGFTNGKSNTNLVANGSFINNFAYFPHLGYNNAFELQDRNKRRKYGLAAVERMKPPSDLTARMNNQISAESDWITLDTTVSTSADQIALAPGYLQKEWTANGRRYFHYKTTSPILGFWAYLSARYEVKRDHWTSPSGERISIEIYYDAKHPYNVGRMIEGVKKSLDYFTRHFSPYQHKQVRILEFPYERFAQSFPNTIPFSESIGFIADLRDEDRIDYVFYVTAHEIAHQWWAHQVIGGDVQGATMIVETMAQYSALMVMEREYGREKMQRFLRYELDRYLSGRGGELVAEMPLMLVENQQYIHYRKGSLAMYALRDFIGEAAVNRALAKFIRDRAFSGPPYTTATELVKYFRAEAGPRHQETIADLFERIVLYDLQAKTAEVKKRPDGRYEVTLTVEAKKLRADAKGEEKPVPIDDWIDVGVFAAAKSKEDLGTALFVEKRRITRPSETFTFVVAQEPKKAGIDPFNKLIDRNPKDNVKSL